MLENKLINKLYCSKKVLSDVTALLSSMSWDRNLLFNINKFFIVDKKDKDIELTIDKILVDKTVYWTLSNFKLELNWLSKELFNKSSINVQIPFLSKWKDITDIFRDSFRQVVRLQYLDDMAYQAYMILISMSKVLHDWKKIWFFFETDIDINASIMKHNWTRNIRIKSNKLKFRSLDLEDVLMAEIEQWFVNKDVWDPNRSWGFTHLLRQHAKFHMTKWFRNVLVNRNKINVIFASRASWKTYNAAYIVCRALLNTKEWYGWRWYREIKYFVPNKDQIWENFFRYCKSLLWSILDIKLNWKKVFRIDETNSIIECTLTWNKMQVVSLHKIIQKSSNELWTSTWEGIACDDAIIDEAARIPDKFWKSFYQRAAFETENFFIITTANEETPADHWAYDLLIRWELWDETISSYRITIDDNEILAIWKSAEQAKVIRDWIKEEVKKEWEEAYYARLYCVIFDKKKLFNVASNLIERQWQVDDNQLRVISLDPAKLSDNAWITVINLVTQTIEISEKLVSTDYDYQLNKVKNLKEKYKWSVAVCDRWWAWEFLSEQDKEWVIDIRIKTTWQWDIRFNDQRWYYTIAKWTMIWFLETLFRKKTLKIYEDLTDLRYQLDKFIEFKSNRSNVIMYKWEWKEKDDLVLSLANATCYIYKILWLHTKEEWENYAKQFDNYSTYAYNENSDDEVYNPYY